MAQQQAPAVGTVMDGYRFKGGDPAQESSWEQVAPIDVSAQYGAGARQLPNGVIERVGPRGGVQRVGSANGGAGGGASALVGADARARFMINFGPLQEAQANLERLDQAGYDPSSLQNGGAAALEAIPFDGGFAARVAGGPDYNAYTQAAKTFEAAIMPIMSGAAVTPSEAQRLIRAALPQPGDSPEVLAQKSAQRRQMINAVAAGIGEAAPYDSPQYGPLPDATAGGFNIRGTTEIAPSGQPYSVVSSQDLAPGDTPEKLRAEGYQQEPDGTWVRYLTPGSAGAGGAPPPSGGSDGVPPTPSPDGGPTDGYQTALEQEQALAAQLDRAGQGYSITDALTGPFNDELAFGAGYLTQGIGNIGRRLTGREVEVSALDRARAARDVMGSQRDNFARERPVQNFFGNALGGAAFGPGGGPSGFLARVGQGAGVGGVYGFASADGSAAERAPSALGGAAIGAVAVPAAERVVAPAASWLAREAGNALAPAGRSVVRGASSALGRYSPAPLREAAMETNALQSSVNRFSTSSPQEINALRSTVEDLRGQGIEPTFADAVNDGGRGTMRALSSRQTPARDAAREFAEGRAEALPSRLSVQARRIVSPDARPVDDIVGDLRAGRAAQARETYAEPYAQPVRIDGQTAAALSGAPGRAAIQRARAAAEAFQDATSVAELDALAAGQTQEVSAATLDRIRQAMSGRAEQLARQPGTRAVGAGVGQRAGQVDQVLDGVEGLAPARQAYRDASRQIDATEMGGRFMTAAPDDFVTAVQGLSPEALQPVRSAMARNIEISARTPGGAPGVARRLYADPETRRMGEAALGQDAGRLAEAARAEARIVRNAADVSPRSGSQTSLNQQDALGAAGEAIGAARDLATGNVPGLATRAINMIRGRGFSDREAEAMVQAAIDPAQTDALITMLAERMTRREARNLARAIRFQVTTNRQSAPQN